jgi:hypothetical protein
VLLKPLTEYFQQVQNAVGQIQDAYVELYEEEVLSPSRINLKIQVRFLTQAFLEISEAIFLEEGKIRHLGYRYHLQDEDNNLIFRYDNTPHYPDLEYFPEHKHLFSEVLSAKRPSIWEVLGESQSLASSK